MILILISWIYILFSAINVGMLMRRFLQWPTTDFVLTFLCGLFFTTLFGGFWAFFYRINYEFHLVLLLINAAIYFTLKAEIKNLYVETWVQIAAIPRNFKIILALIFVIILAKCSLMPFILDNESYYLQTIKWLNEYGYVKGIANIHMYLGQQSGLHLTQSIFNFSFIYGNFNDINGLFLLVGNVFAFLKLSEYKNSKRFHFLIVGLFPMANILLLQFVSAPSPDFPIYILTFVIIFCFIEEYENERNSYFLILVVLSLYAIFIKPTAVILAIFPVILFFRNRSRWKNIGIVTTFSAVTLALFVGKNFITSGHPFFPIVWSPTAVNFALPNEITQLYYQQTKLYSFHLTANEYANLTSWELFMSWLTMPKLHGFFNKISIILVFVVPLFIRLKLNSRVWWIIYYVMLAQLILLASSSPQYRFFLNFILLFAIVMMSFLIIKLKILNLVLYGTTTIAALLLFVPMNLSMLSANQSTQKTHTFALKNMLLPSSNSSLQTKFIRFTDKNFIYYSPVNDSLLWRTGDGPLPCVNERQINLFKKKYRIVPQPFSTNLKDGFFSEGLQIIE